MARGPDYMCISQGHKIRGNIISFDFEQWYWSVFVKLSFHILYKSWPRYDVYCFLYDSVFFELKFNQIRCTRNLKVNKSDIGKIKFHNYLKNTSGGKISLLLCSWFSVVSVYCTKLHQNYTKSSTRCRHWRHWRQKLPYQHSLNKSTNQIFRKRNLLKKLFQKRVLEYACNKPFS